MSKNLLTFEIGALMAQHLGATELYSFDGPIEFEDFKVASNLKGEVELMRIEDGVNVSISNVEIHVERICSLSLDNFNEKVSIKRAERQFYKEIKDDSDPNDIFLIDTKRHTLDIEEMLRQEIILHFSPIPVSSTSSKLKWQDKDAPDEGETGHKPFAQLKDLLK